MKMTAEELKVVLELHKKWVDSEEGGKRANLSGANLSGAYLSGADLSGAYLSRADLFRADLSGADLSRANLSRADLSEADLSGAYLSRAYLSEAKINWQSHQLLSEILLRSAEESVERRMVAGLIRISTDWCWEKLLSIEHPEKEWALAELRKWVQEDDDAPEILKPEEKV